MKITRFFGLALVALSSAVASAQPTPIPPPPDLAVPPADAVKTASGLVSKVLKPGTGTEHPGANDRVTVNYTGWLTDGAMFDSTTRRGKPSVIPLDRVIPGFAEGVQLMVKGEKRRIWIPESLAYKGEAHKPPGTLVFDVELVDFAPAPTPPPVPADVASPPADAEVTKSGLASKVLHKGTGTEHPKASSRVTVQYTGWTTDGKMFDSSVMRGQPATFPLDRVIPGWTEGLQLMVTGEKRRFWIPAKLAYEGKKGAPQGTLVFDVELISFE
jgi:FKBP-type peptidyl-prolyl cis-trans isomerase